MKRVYAILLAAMMMVGIHTTAFAVDSPKGTTTVETEDKSPKTGDSDILYIEIAGVLLAATAVVAGKRFRKTATK